MGSVGSVVSVGKSERSPEPIMVKVFQNAYTDYTDYNVISLDLHHWLNTMPLHPAGGTWLVNVDQLVLGFLEEKPDMTSTGQIHSFHMGYVHEAGLLLSYAKVDILNTA